MDSADDLRLLQIKLALIDADLDWRIRRALQDVLPRRPGQTGLVVPQQRETPNRPA